MPSDRWSDRIKAHPALKRFEPLTGPAFDELVEDIRRSGVQEPIVLWCDPESSDLFLLDGRNRIAAVERGVGEVILIDGDLYVVPFEEMQRQATPDSPWYLGINECIPLPCRQVLGDDPDEISLSLNLHRRHLTAEQKNKLIDELLKANPERSDRATGRIVGRDHKTVAARRGELEANGEIPHTADRAEASGRKARGRKPTAVKREAKPRQTTAQLRDNAICVLSTLLRRHVLDTIADFNRLLDDERGIEEVPVEKRIALLRDHARALRLSLNDLQFVGQETA
jgi:hypothetical protein